MELNYVCNNANNLLKDNGKMVKDMDLVLNSVETGFLRVRILKSKKLTIPTEPIKMLTFSLENKNVNLFFKLDK